MAETFLFVCKGRGVALLRPPCRHNQWE